MIRGLFGDAPWNLAATVHNGVVIFDDGGSLPEGTRVVVAEDAALAPATHFELFREIVGRAEGVPQEPAEGDSEKL